MLKCTCIIQLTSYVDLKRFNFSWNKTVWWRCCWLSTLFYGIIRIVWPCLMEMWKNLDPVWWRNEKNLTLFDGEMKYFWPCLMEKWNIFDPVWWKNSRKRTLFGPSIVYRRALEFHPRALRLYFPNSDERHGVSDKPELMALLILKLLSTVLRGTVLY